MAEKRSERPTVSAPTPEALEEAADFLVRCRGTEAWEIYEEHAAMVRAAAARIRKLEAQLGAEADAWDVEGFPENAARTRAVLAHNESEGRDG